MQTTMKEEAFADFKFIADGVFVSAPSWQPGRGATGTGPLSSQFAQEEGASECLPF